MRRLKACLNTALIAVHEHVHLISSFTSKIDMALPASLRGHCFVVNLQDGCLTLGVSDAVWLMPLRYELPALRDHLRKTEGCYALASIEIKVFPTLASDNNCRARPVKWVCSDVAKKTLKGLREWMHDTSLCEPNNHEDKKP